MNALHRTVLCLVLLLSACTPSRVVENETRAAKLPSPTALISPAPVSLPTQNPRDPLEPNFTPTAEPTPALNIRPRLVWFYKAPEDGDFAAIAANFDMAILSAGNESDRDKLRSLGMAGPFLQYLRFDVIQDPGSCTRTPWKNQAANQPGDFCRISSEHPDWFLLDQDGNRITNPYGGEKFFMMDPGKPGWRSFWLERARQVQDQGGWDGIFLDNVEVSYAFREERHQLPQAYPDEPSYLKAIQGFLWMIYQGYTQPNGKLLYANLIAQTSDADWSQFLNYLDGAMHEGWAIDGHTGYRSPQTWENHLRLVEETLAAGKTILLVSQGQQDDGELQLFAYASYLLVMQGKAYFRFANSDNYREAWLYPDYQIDLGRPRGSRYPVGEAWRRDFAYGWVEVNPTQHTARIELAVPPPAAEATATSASSH